MKLEPKKVILFIFEQLLIYKNAFSCRKKEDD